MMPAGRPASVSNCRSCTVDRVSGTYNGNGDIVRELFIAVSTVGRVMTTV